MTISFEAGDETRKILAIYIQIEEGAVSRTVEIEEDACYADEDETGRLLGVEILDPAALARFGRQIAERYPQAALDELLEQTRLALV